MWYALMLTMLLGCSVSQAPKIEAITGLSMGTSYTVKWVQRVDQKSQINGDIARGVAIELERIEASMSTYMDASDLSGLMVQVLGNGIAFQQKWPH